jgi:putative Ca2+/H+ antiporter (TMEM165/GDT1 family)
MTMDYAVLLSTFALLFLAEMGDKTQLMAMTLAHRYRALPVILGTFAAFALLNLLAVLVGEGLAQIIPRKVVLIAAGLLFLLFAWRSWRDSGEEATQATTIDHRRAWLASFSLIFVAELGDKTQLAMVALAAKTGALWSVFVGGTLALWAVSLLGILVGATLLRKVEPRWVHGAAALLFALFGLLALWQGLSGILAPSGAEL